MKIAGKIVFYVLGGGILLYVILSIGVGNIYHSMISADATLLFFGLALTALAAAVRIYKFNQLLDNMSLSRTLEIFVSSRIGKEVSFIGHFMPLIKKSNRQGGVFKNLIIDRYTEILATLLIAFISFFLVWQRNAVMLLLSGATTVCLALMLTLPFISSSLLRRQYTNKLMMKITGFIKSLQERLKLNSNKVLQIYLLSVISTILDFCAALVIFNAYDVSLNFFYIPITWASSALASMLAFMLIGVTEVSVIYLYSFLAGVKEAVTASFLIVSRILNVVLLGFLFMILIVMRKERKSGTITT